ncbi:MAG TPA: right-handed parallel beta-helix repeat-containing protein [Gaiellaceae bacterium]|jgi:nitrous oxidase accessory protein NosD|nr:right-handed parallel beta-helix repeat-containing protein [Gaiellaceae bacterium]
MSYTLIGRIQTRVVSTLPALLVALALQRWWAIELVALMLGLGLVLDPVVYDRVLAYQPAWLALPLGVLELGLVYGAMRWLQLMAPLRWALALYAIGWVAAQLFGHAVFPRLHLEYAEDGGELGRRGALTAVAVAAIVVSGLGAAYAVRPPTVHLHGQVQGPLVIRHAQTLVGGTVKGGILIRANKVTLRNVTVIGGENGIDILDSHHVMLDNVRIVGVTLDGIHVRRSSVMIENCKITSPNGPWVQGIDISFSMDKEMSMVEGCTIVGVREGIVTHMTMVDVTHNHIGATSLRGITMGEMSMGAINHNDVLGAHGVGIICLDHSECSIEHNTIVGTRTDPSGDPSRAGVAIEAHYFAKAKVKHNTIVASPGGVQAFDQASVTR